MEPGSTRPVVVYGLALQSTFGLWGQAVASGAAKSGVRRTRLDDQDLEQAYTQLAAAVTEEDRQQKRALRVRGERFVRD